MKKSDELFIRLAEKYEKYRKDFEDQQNKAMTIQEHMSAYASYTGKLEALFDALTIEYNGVKT